MRKHVVLSIQSEVVRGHVGNSAARFAMQRNGIDVWSLPSVLLSNHPGHRRATGETIDAPKILALFDGIRSNGWLTEIGAILSGYLGHPAQASVTAEIVRSVKAANPGAIYLCDPVFGDDDGAYAKPGVAESIARELIPLADISCPNRFELSSLTSHHIGCPMDAVRAARQLGVSETVVTSVPDKGKIANVVVTKAGAWSCSVNHVENVPHGTGDLLAALYLSHRLRGDSCQQALLASVSKVERVILASAGQDELQLIPAQEYLRTCDPIDGLTSVG